MIPIAFFDTETYPNYFLLKFKIGSQYHKVEIVNEQSMLDHHKRFVYRIFDTYTCISFNGINYDIPMITAALHGFNNQQLKSLNDKIIMENIKHWQLNLPKWQPGEHIDLIEVAPGKASLKAYAGRIHSKKIQDLPYDPNRILSDSEMKEVDLYCGNDLDVLEDLYNSLKPQLEQREQLSKRYGINLMSKSDAQLAEAVLKKRCEDALSTRIYKSEIDWNMQIKYQPPDFINFYTPELRETFQIVKESIFTLDSNGSIKMPAQLDGLEIKINEGVYKLGIGGLHSQEKKSVHVAYKNYLLIDNDVASYYPTLILNSGKYPEALGSTFLKEYQAIKDERLMWKQKQKELKGKENTSEYKEAEVGNEGGKIMINGTFGKTGSPYSILFAPKMLLQTTVTGQLALLMLIEMHEMLGISVISANTDGMVIKCHINDIEISKQLIKQWEFITCLEMEETRYSAIYSRDVNNYFAIKTNGEVKRKGEYSKSGINEKKNPDVEICSDAVAEFLSKEVPIDYTIRMCQDIRKFIVVQKVNGGAVKLHGAGADKNARVSEMIPILYGNEWVKEGRKWRKGDLLTDSSTAYKSCFKPQVREYLGKVARWYYSNNCPGTIVYANNGNTVSVSEGAKPCMILPETLPEDIDYDWYIRKANSILEDVGYF